MAGYTLTLSISSESPSELAETVDALGKSLSALNASTHSVITFPRGHVAPQVGPIAWYSQRAGEFLDELTPDAARAVLFVARHAPTVPIESLSRELRMGTGPALAGKLASIGWAVRRLSAPPPFRRNREAYEMDHEVASALLAASSSSGRRRGPIRGTDRPMVRAGGQRRG